MCLFLTIKYPHIFFGLLLALSDFLLPLFLRFMSGSNLYNLVLHACSYCPVVPTECSIQILQGKNIVLFISKLIINPFFPQMNHTLQILFLNYRYYFWTKGPKSRLNQIFYMFSYFNHGRDFILKTCKIFLNFEWKGQHRTRKWCGSVFEMTLQSFCCHDVSRNHVIFWI